ncbi:MAG: hypothetical protein AAGJ08_00395 [Cyanobacteria bacterium P01_H01_bin.35]
MKKQLEQRLQQLKTEYESGQQVLAELQTKQTNRKETLLRIAGAIKVLEEELAKTEEENNNDSPEISREREIITNSYCQT